MRLRELPRVHTPFSLSDLNQCLTCLGRLSEDSTCLTEEFQALTLSSDLIWKDVNFILSHCCISEEKARIGAQAQKYADELHITQPRRCPVGLKAVPLMDPSWDCQPGQPGFAGRDPLPH